MTVRLEEGDCLEVVPRLVAEGITVDAIVTDPPYDLISVSRNGSTRNNDPNTPFGRTKLNGKGFMSMSWDGTGIAFRPETWATIAAILRPGGFLLAFGGTRTSHRVVCAIEDSGFVIQDTIMWLYGAGFPKNRNSLKPAFEPICLAYKPAGKRSLSVDECRVETNDTLSVGSNNRTNTNVNFGMKDNRPCGKRTLQVDECRIDGEAKPYGNPTKSDGHNLHKRVGEWEPNLAGRWPANVIHDGSDEVLEAFAAFGDRPHSFRTSRNHQAGEFGWHAGNTPGFNDNGSVARFFYSAKAGPEDRWGSKHPTVKPVELIRYLVRLVCPKGGTFLDPFAGSGTAGVAALAEGRNAILIEQSAEYCSDIRERMAHYEGEGRHSLASKNRAAIERGPLPLFDGT